MSTERTGRRIRRQPPEETQEERLRRAILTDGYVEAFYSTRTMRIPEFGVRASVLPYPVRVQEEINGADLLAAAVKEDIPRHEPLETLARQLSIWESKKDVDVWRGKSDQRISLSSLWRAPGVLNGRKKMPYPVAQTMLGIIHHDLAINVDPRIFLENYVHIVPSDWEGTSATLVGSCLIEAVDDNEPTKRRVFLRQNRTYFDEECWSISGGHYDNMREVAGLEEGKEEAGILPDLMRWAVPLGVAYQVFPKREVDREPSDEMWEYLNICWRLPLRESELDVQLGEHRLVLPLDERGHEPWKSFDQSGVAGLAEEGLLTPIALCSLIWAGYLEAEDYPEVVFQKKD